jgi:hypothetical protein
LILYESEVFTLGVWKNFEELESSLTLNELLELYSSIKKQEMRQLKMHLKAQGANVEVFNDEESKSEDKDKPKTAMDFLQETIGGSDEDDSGSKQFFPGISMTTT